MTGLFSGVSVKELSADVCTNYKLKLNEKLLSISIPFSKNPNGVGLVGILTSPPTSLIPEEELVDNPTKAGTNYPPTHKLALIVHGKGGHKNYCYQANVADELANQLGTYSFRFDFRGCGDSQDNEDETFGRTVKEDIEDIELVLDVFQNGATFEQIGINLIPNSIIGHSRGSVALFQWALLQQQKSDRGEPHQFVPNLVNVSGRYDSQRLLTPFGEPRGGAIYLKQYRYGKYTRLLIPVGETKDLGTQDLSPLRDLDDEVQVFSIYGLADHIVPVEDSSFFANLLGSRHKLTLIPHADHNFYGVHPISESNIAKYNPENLPLRKDRVNYNYKVTEEIVQWLTTNEDTKRFKKSSKVLYYYPRWRNIDGISNFRDIGGWRTNDNKHYVKSGLIFRCANTSKVTEYGKQQLRDLRVTAVFDFRSVGEFKKQGGLSIDGIKVLNVPVYQSTDISPQGMALRYKNLLSSWFTFKFVYRDILNHGVPAFKVVFEYLRDNPNSPIVFNCQAGKDRTGVMAMLILLLLNVDTHTIAKEYELTTIGIIPDRDAIKKEFLYMSEGFKKKLDESNQSLPDGLNNLNLTPDEQFENLISSKYESMVATIELFNKEFGGIDNYFHKYLEFSDSDILKIKENLLSGLSPYPDQNALWKHRSHAGNLL